MKPQKTAHAFSRWINLFVTDFCYGRIFLPNRKWICFPRNITSIENITENLGKNSNFIAQTSKDIRESSQQLASASTTQAETLKKNSGLCPWK